MFQSSEAIHTYCTAKLGLFSVVLGSSGELGSGVKSVPRQAAELLNYLL